MSYREDPIWSIRNLRLFQDLSHEVLRELSPFLNVHQYRRGEVICLTFCCACSGAVPSDTDSLHCLMSEKRLGEMRSELPARLTGDETVALDPRTMPDDTGDPNGARPTGSKSTRRVAINRTAGSKRVEGHGAGSACITHEWRRSSHSDPHEEGKKRSPALTSAVAERSPGGHTKRYGVSKGNLPDQ
jgi:hypothetical protein